MNCNCFAKKLKLKWRFHHISSQSDSIKKTLYQRLGSPWMWLILENQKYINILHNCRGDRRCFYHPHSFSSAQKPVLGKWDTEPSLDHFEIYCTFMPPVLFIVWKAGVQAVRHVIKESWAHDQGLWGHSKTHKKCTYIHLFISQMLMLWPIVKGRTKLLQ